MKKEKISMALNDIDEKYVEKAANFKKKRTTLPIVKWGALVASLAIVIAGTALILPRLDTASVPPIQNDSTTENVIETTGGAEIGTYHTTTPGITLGTTPTQSGEVALIEQYTARITNGAYKNYAPMTALKTYEASIGEKLTDVTVWGFWASNDKDFFDADDYTGEEKIETLRAEVYALEGISPEIAVLVKYLDQGEALTLDHYYVFVNRDVENKIENLADFYTKLNADHYFTVKWNDMLVQTRDLDRSVYRTDNTIITNLRDMLLSLNGTIARTFTTYTKELTFDIDMDSIGAYTGYASVYDNGYITFTFHSTNHFTFSFDIGEENAKSIISYIEENAEVRHSEQYATTDEYTLTHTYTGMTVETTFCENDTAYENKAESMTSGAYIPE